MKKMTEYLLEVAFICLMIRILSLGAGIGEAIALISLVSSMGYKQWLSKTQHDELDAINKKYDDLATQVQSLHLDRALRRSVNEQKEIKSATVSGKRLF